MALNGAVRKLFKVIGKVRWASNFPAIFITEMLPYSQWDSFEFISNFCVSSVTKGMSNAGRLIFLLLHHHHLLLLLHRGLHLRLCLVNVFLFFFSFFHHHSIILFIFKKIILFYFIFSLHFKPYFTEPFEISQTGEEQEKKIFKNLKRTNSQNRLANLTLQ